MECFSIRVLSQIYGFRESFAWVIGLRCSRSWFGREGLGRGQRLVTDCRRVDESVDLAN